MEVSVSMRASDLTVLIYHPVMDKSGAGDAKKKASASGEPNSLGVVVRDGDDESGDDTDDPDAQSLTRQNSGGSVVVGEDEGQMSTSDAMNRRDAMLLPALAAATTIEVRGGMIPLIHRIKSCLRVCVGFRSRLSHLPWVMEGAGDAGRKSAADVTHVVASLVSFSFS